MALSDIFDGNKRTALIRKNILASFLIKGWTGLVYLLIVPVTLKCLGEYENGIWLTISAMLIWIDNMDIGLGNGLRNSLATHLAHGQVDEARKYVSNTLFMLVCIIVPTMFTLCLITYFSDTYSFLNVDPAIVKDLDHVIIISLIFVCCTFVLKFIGNLYLGLQLPAVSNLLVCCGYTLSFIGTAILYFTHYGSLLNIAMVNTASPLVVYLILYPYTFYMRYPQLRPHLKDWDLRITKGLFQVGIKFFLLQMSSSFVFMSSSLLMSRLFSPQEVTPYQITYRYFSIILHAFTVIANPYWSATTDAYERGDFEWILRSAKKMNKIIMACAGVIVIATLISQYVYQAWIGHDVVIPWKFSVGMAMYIFIILYCLAYCYFLNGLGALNIQLVCTLGGAALFFVLVIAFKSIYHDPVIIIIALCLSNIPSMIGNRVQFYKISHHQAHGIWKR